MAAKRSKCPRAEGQALAPWSGLGAQEPWSSFFRGWPFSGRLPRLLDERYRDWPWSGLGRASASALDVREDEAGYTIRVELPGCRKEDVHVELHAGMLTIRGESRRERGAETEQLRYVERSYGAFSRSLRLPADADAEHLDASFQDGVLTLTIPKRKTDRTPPRMIVIR